MLTLCVLSLIQNREIDELDYEVLLRLDDSVERR